MTRPAPEHFLQSSTPSAWLAQAGQHLPELLVDHANCEKKAASTALSLLYRYVDRTALLQALSPLAREELRHFEQVTALLAEEGIRYEHLSSSRYAGRLRDCVRKAEPHRLIDTLLVSAVVEARSCERFCGLVEVLPPKLAKFYAKLSESEARHYRLYLDLAEEYAADHGGLDAYSSKLQEILDADALAVSELDTEFRFHSGPLAQSSAVR